MAVVCLHGSSQPGLGEKLVQFISIFAVGLAKIVGLANPQPIMLCFFPKKTAVKNGEKYISCPTAVWGIANVCSKNDMDSRAETAKKKCRVKNI